MSFDSSSFIYKISRIAVLRFVALKINSLSLRKLLGASYWEALWIRQIPPHRQARVHRWSQALIAAVLVMFCTCALPPHLKIQRKNINKAIDMLQCWTVKSYIFLYISLYILLANLWINNTSCTASPEVAVFLNTSAVSCPRSVRCAYNLRRDSFRA